MGLDAVELVIRFEGAFGIRIPDEVAVHRCVLSIEIRIRRCDAL